MPTPVKFIFSKKTTLPNRKELKKFILFLFQQESRQVEYINYIFCSDKKILDINMQYLQHDYFTDIITFEHNTAQQPVQSDIFISIDTVTSNAATLNIVTEDELLRVIFHGALHLCGYQDKSTPQQNKMRKKEDYYLSLYKGEMFHKK